MAAAAEGGPAPEYLEYAFNLRSWNIAPYAGPSREWPPGEFRKIKAAWAYYQAWKAWLGRDTWMAGVKEKAATKWQAAHADFWPLIQDIIKLRSEKESE